MDKDERGYGWLDDAFDDSKQVDELKRAQASQRTGCIVLVLVVLVAAVALTVLGCSTLSSLVTLG
ncbi:hypothetical protein [Corynebacterium stationis]|uniref:hypothetical protein n=1 Tax=Corynebacterium stationis TaxID=1705 RepID=UPI00263AFDA1|nr:hypothetical protein [Corynebacterium stationis]